ncbi:MAG: putative DNA binding domain-containing protein [Salinivirgaceae bacterium]|nr:putative DNA binding domain-containing protein [Salinivirgaceae bacterium]
MTKEELLDIVKSDESYRIERTTSTGDMDKFQEAICAFANDLPGSRKKGYLLIGVRDNGKIDGLKVDDALMKKISSIRSDGNILPLPIMSTEKVATEEGDVLVVEVTPSFDTPVRYRGRSFVRIGPRRDIASAEEERILAERCAASLPTFDTRPCRDATIDDIDTETIVREYMPKAIAADVLAAEKRPLKEQLASLRLYNLQFDCPTYAALIMFGKNPRYFMMGDYIQFVRFRGENNGGEILNERRFEGCLYKILPKLENFIRDGIVTKRPVPVSILRETNVLNYPFKALRELLMNAVMHRDYQSNMPTRLYQYDKHIEIMNPGGLYGQARPENFPLVNDYRNGVVAEMMRNLDYVNMFNHGVNDVQELLKENNSPAAVFNVDLLTVFSVIVKEPDDVSLLKLYQSQSANYEGAMTELYQKCPSFGKARGKVSNEAILALLQVCESSVAVKEIMVACNVNSRMSFDRQLLKPAANDDLIKPLFPDNPRHPQQKYILTEKGKELLNSIKSLIHS